jgi:hypothetical protein
MESEPIGRPVGIFMLTVNPAPQVARLSRPSERIWRNGADIQFDGAFLAYPSRI